MYEKTSNKMHNSSINNLKIPCTMICLVKKDGAVYKTSIIKK